MKAKTQQKRKRARRQIWVIKAGSSLVVDGGPLIVRAWMQQVSQLRRQHHASIIWVTSGAIATARERTNHHKSPRNKLPEKQALSAIGQPLVMDCYNLALQRVGLIGAQVLLTYDDIESRKRRANLRNTLETLLSWDIVPVLNENDAVATEEIQFGDNDTLSAKVASLIEADRLVIMTNVEGLYDKDPNSHADAKILSEVPRVTKSLLASVDPGAVSSKGTGGMFSKLRAAAHAQTAGIETWLLRGDIPDGLMKIARGEAIGTRLGGGR